MSFVITTTAATIIINNGHTDTKSVTYVVNKQIKTMSRSKSQIPNTEIIDKRQANHKQVTDKPMINNE